MVLFHLTATKVQKVFMFIKLYPMKRQECSLKRNFYPTNRGLLAFNKLSNINHPSRQ